MAPKDMAPKDYVVKKNQMIKDMMICLDGAAADELCLVTHVDSSSSTTSANDERTTGQQLHLTPAPGRQCLLRLSHR
jgi:hypothetical protein